MTDEERWKVINEVEAGDLLGAMKAVGDACRAALGAGAKVEEVRLLSLALRKKFVEAWAMQQGAK